MMLKYYALTRLPKCEGKSGKGANHAGFLEREMARAVGEKPVRLSFPAAFLWFFLFLKKERTESSEPSGEPGVWGKPQEV